MLPPKKFGLKDIWKRQQDVPEDKRFRPWPDFSDVKVRCRQREEHGLRDTSPHAEAIFAVIEPMGRPDRAEADQRHALQLAKIALSMPHGDKGSVIKALLTLPRPALEKRDLWVSLVLAGETVSTETVLDGLKELLEKAKQKPWLLDEQHNGIEEWLELLPFSDRPAAVHDALALVDMRFREPWRLRRLLSALGKAPNVQAEQVLRELANRDPRLYSEYEWLKAVVGRATPSSAMLLLDLFCDGKLPGKGRDMDRLTLPRYLAGVMRNHPEMRCELIRRYERQAVGVNKEVIEYTIEELADPDALLAVLRIYARDKRHFDLTLRRMVEEIALGKQPLADWRGAYELFSVNTAALRKRLFAMLDGEPAVASVAESCLTAIDELRDEHG